MAYALRVMNFPENGAAHRAGIQPGDILVSYDGVPLHCIEDLQTAQAQAEGKKSVRIVIDRGGAKWMLNADAGPLEITFGESPALPPNSDTSENNNPLEFKSNYTSIKPICGLITVVGWIAVAFGAIAGIFLIRFFDGLMIAIWGLILVLGAQASKAIADSADYSREILVELKKRPLRNE